MGHAGAHAASKARCAGSLFVGPPGRRASCLLRVWRRRARVISTQGAQVCAPEIKQNLAKTWPLMERQPPARRVPSSIGRLAGRASTSPPCAPADAAGRTTSSERRVASRRPRALPITFGRQLWPTGSGRICSWPETPTSEARQARCSSHKTRRESVFELGLQFELELELELQL